MLPPGEYSVDVSELSGVIVLHGSSGTSVALITTLSDPASHTTTAKLIFERRDGMAYLSAVAWQDRNASVTAVFKHVTKGAGAVALR
jgi:hypothetical protein